MMENIKCVSIRCDDFDENVVFMKFESHDGDSWYEINVEDSCCRGDGNLKERLRRVWHAFWGEPIYYSGIYVGDVNRIKTFLKDCCDIVGIEHE